MREYDLSITPFHPQGNTLTAAQKPFCSLTSIQGVFVFSLLQ